MRTSSIRPSRWRSATNEGGKADDEVVSVEVGVHVEDHLLGAAPVEDDVLDLDQRSITRATVGRAEPMSSSSSPGASRGAVWYDASPDSTAVAQVWQTPVRHDHCVGTSHASASSSTDEYVSDHAAVSAERAKVTAGPAPGGPGG